jgi:peptidoglycan/LPS O-acetylase OafA/YrhL
MTLAERLGTAARAGNFDLVRLAAASAVVLCHSFELTGLYWREPLRLLTGDPSRSTGRLAVEVFFVLSGFLIARSWEQSPGAAAFFRNRVLRIWPALILAVALTVLVIGPAFTTLSTADYFGRGRTWKYFANLLLYPQRPALPGVFADGSVHVSADLWGVNVPLWTLPIEFSMYLAVAAAGTLGLLRRAYLAAMAAVALTCLYVFVLTWDGVWGWRLLGLHVKATVGLAGYFAAGAALYRHRAQVPHSGVLAAAAAGLWVLSLRHPLHDLAAVAAVPYLTLWLALADAPVLRGFGRWGDFSYGLYVLTFPMQRALVETWHRHLGRPPEWWELFAASMAVALPAAAASWHLVEKPALRFKSRPAPPPEPQPAPPPG